MNYGIHADYGGEHNVEKQVGEKRKASKIEKNIAAGQEPKVRQRGSRKGKSPVLNASNSNVNAQAVSKERLQMETDGKIHVSSQDGKDREVSDGALEQRRERPRTPKSSDRRQLSRNSEMDSKKSSQLWTSKDEILLACQFLKDLKSAGTFPPKTSADYWEEVRMQLKGKLDVDWSRDQIYNKYRRMKVRYSILTQRMQSSDSKLPKCKDSEEEKLYRILAQLWGNLKIQDQKPLQKPSSVPSKEDSPQDEDINQDSEEKSVDEKFTKQTELPPTSTVAKSKLKRAISASASKIKAPETDLTSMQGNGNNVRRKIFFHQFQADDVSSKNTSFDTIRALNFVGEMEKSFAKLVKEEHDKVNDLLANFRKQMDERFQWLLESAYVQVAGAGTYTPLMCGQFSDGLAPLHALDLESNQHAPIFWQGLVDQQGQEVQVLQRKMELMQSFLHSKEEELKSKLTMNKSNC